MELVDLNISKEYLGDSNELFELVRNSFLETYKNYIEELEKLHTAKELYSPIHSLKGITLNLGFKKLYDSSNQVLVKLREDIVDYDLLSQYKDIFRKSYDEMKELL